MKSLIAFFAFLEFSDEITVSCFFAWWSSFSRNYRIIYLCDLIGLFEWNSWLTLCYTHYLAFQLFHGHATRWANILNRMHYLLFKALRMESVPRLTAYDDLLTPELSKAKSTVFFSPILYEWRAGACDSTCSALELLSVISANPVLVKCIHDWHFA